MPTNKRVPGGNPQGLQTTADVRQMLATEIETVNTHPDLDPIRKAQAIARLARIALRAIELDGLRARVEAIETTLRLRTNDQPKDQNP